METTIELQYGLGTMNYTLWTTRCRSLYNMQCLPLVNLWWKPPQPWPCQTRPTSWVKHTGKRQRLMMEMSSPYMLENNMALLHPELFNSDLFVFSSSEVVHFAVLFLHLWLIFEHALINVTGSFWVFGEKQAFT